MSRLVLALCVGCVPWTHQAYPVDTGDAAEPTARFSHPPPGAELPVGTEMRLFATVSHPTQTLSTLEVRLQVDQGQVSGWHLASDGALTWEGTVAAGAHQARLAITDDRGRQATAQTDWSGVDP